MLRALKEQRRLVAGTGLFVCGILLLTKLDHIVNSTFYSYGLKFSMDWYWQYSVVYFILNQCVAVGAYYFARRRELLIMAEAFVLSGTQDLVYFGVWNGGVFPHGQWSWTPYFWLAGCWTTAHQVALSVSSLVVAGCIVAILWWRAGYVKKRGNRCTGGLRAEATAVALGAGEPGSRIRRQKAVGRRQ
jgi:hypothetical protein